MEEPIAALQSSAEAQRVAASQAAAQAEQVAAAAGADAGAAALLAQSVELCAAQLARLRDAEDARAGCEEAAQAVAAAERGAEALAASVAQRRVEVRELEAAVEMHRREAALRLEVGLRGCVGAARQAPPAVPAVCGVSLLRVS